MLGRFDNGQRSRAFGEHIFFISYVIWKHLSLPIIMSGCSDQDLPSHGKVPPANA